MHGRHHAHPHPHRPGRRNEDSPNEYAHCALEPQNAQVVENQDGHFEVHGERIAAVHPEVVGGTQAASLRYSRLTIGVKM